MLLDRQLPFEFIVFVLKSAQGTGQPVHFGVQAVDILFGRFDLIAQDGVLIKQGFARLLVGTQAFVGCFDTLEHGQPFFPDIFYALLGLECGKIQD